MSERDELPGRLGLVAGADVSYDRGSPVLFAAVVVLGYTLFTSPSEEHLRLCIAGEGPECPDETRFRRLGPIRLGPLGYGLAGTGIVWALGAKLFGEELAPWVTMVVGGALGVSAYAISVALD